jgi:capsular polysaccharide biosynthesis protein
MNIIHQKHKAFRKKPVNLKSEDLILFAHELEKDIRDTHAITLRNAYILQDSIFTLNDLKFYTEYTHVTGLRKKLRLKRTLHLLKSGLTVEKGLWIIDDWSAGYFHWLTDALPRFIALNTSDIPVLLPMHYKQMAYVTQSLDYLGIKAIYFDTASPVKVKELLLVSHTSNTGNYNKILINLLRDEFLSRQSIVKPHRKIYISRKKAPKRFIKNEDELHPVFLKHGYEIHYFEDYDFATQVKLMSEAKVVAGLHGAGLTNMLFMQKGGQVLELRNKDDAHNNCYFSLASELDLDYFYLLNEGNGDTHLVHVAVDAKELDATLGEMDRHLQN